MMKGIKPSALLMALLLAQSVNAFSAPVADAEKAMTEAEIQAVEANIQQIRKSLDDLNKERTSTQSKIQESDREISKVQKKITTLEAEVREGQNEVKKIQSRQKALTANIEQQKDQIARSLRSMYINSSDSRLKLLLNQEDPEALTRQLTYLEYSQDAQLKAVREFESAINEQQELEDRQQALLAQLSRERNALSNEKSKMEIQQQKRQKLLANLNQKSRNSARELDQMEKQHKQLQQALAEIISRRIENSQPFDDRKGKMTWPLEGKVLFAYNQKRPETRLSWPGVFIESRPGIPVKAVHDGRVIFADWMRGYGLLTIVDHGDDYLTLYAHNEWVLKTEGEVVTAGEPLALSGQSGGQLAPGLYFEVRKKGNPQNPDHWLKR